MMGGEIFELTGRRQTGHNAGQNLPFPCDLVRYFPPSVFFSFVRVDSTLVRLSDFRLSHLYPVFCLLLLQIVSSATKLALA